jgi:multiple sugar transport system substrate-binding protein
MDNLMLFYNTDIFSEKRVRNAPKTLQELVNLVPVLTERDSAGNIIRSAIALGETSDSIPGASGIIAALMMQYGADMTSPDNSKATFDLPVANTNPPVLAGQEALSFYAQFADPTSPLYTYTGKKDSNDIRAFPSDVQAFMEGKSAMMLGYGYQVQNIRKFNPSLKFETAPMPQNNIQDPVTIANYWGEVVSKNSEHPNEAWDFINYMTQRARQNSLFRLTGRIPARKDSLEANTSRKYYAAVAQQAEHSQSWYRHNSSDVEKIFDQMINNVLHDKISSRVAVETAVRDINALK